MKVNELRRRKLRRKNPWQQAKHLSYIMTYSMSEKEPVIAPGSRRRGGVLGGVGVGISVSAVLHGTALLGLCSSTVLAADHAVLQVYGYGRSKRLFTVYTYRV